MTGLGWTRLHRRGARDWGKLASPVFWRLQRGPGDARGMGFLLNKSSWCQACDGVVMVRVMTVGASRVRVVEGPTMLIDRWARCAWWWLSTA